VARLRGSAGGSGGGGGTYITPPGAGAGTLTKVTPAAQVAQAMMAEAEAVLETPEQVRPPQMAGQV